MEGSKGRLVSKEVAKHGAVHLDSEDRRRLKASIGAACSLVEGARIMSRLTVLRATTATHETARLRVFPCLLRARQPTRNLREAHFKDGGGLRLPRMQHVRPYLAVAPPSRPASERSSMQREFLCRLFRSRPLCPHRRGQRLRVRRGQAMLRTARRRSRPPKPSARAPWARGDSRRVARFLT